MAKVPAIIPVTELRQDAAAALKRARQSRQPVVITQRGRAAAVLVSIEAFEHAEHERRILHLLARGEREIAAGLGFDLDAVLADADEVLAKR
jgi:prevent-host-death family protein